MMTVGFIILIIASYLLGAIPFGLLIARAHGIDLRKVGSGNIGATNVSRALGKKWAYFCFILDMAKGLLPMLLATAWGLVDKDVSLGQLGMWLASGVRPSWDIFFGVFGVQGSKGVAPAW
jgi:glycerol-3-phosphate acyltransferase PlsY